MKLFTLGFKKFILTLIGFSTTGATIFVATQSGQYENFVPKKTVDEEEKKLEQNEEKKEINSIINNELGKEEVVLDPKIVYGDRSEYMSGVYKIGILGSDVKQDLYGKEIKKTINDYTIDDETKNIGSMYSKLPKNLMLYNSQIHSKVIPFEEAIISQSANRFINTFFKLVNTNNLPTKEKPISISSLLLGKFKTAIMKNKIAFFKLGKDIKYFDHNNVWKLIDEFFLKSDLAKKEFKNINFVKGNTRGDFNNVIVFGSLLQSDVHQTFINYQGQENSASELEKVRKNVQYDYFSNFKKDYDKYNTFFVNVIDGVHNTQKFYNLIDDKNDKNFILIGDKAKYLKNSSSQMAKTNITTGTYSEITSAYMGGFQSAILAIDKVNNKYVKTKLSFLIGSISDDSLASKKAKAFKQGVIAAASHYKFNQYLSVSFTSDDIFSYSVANLKQSNVLGTIANKENFKNSDERIVYIAGTSSQDWKGQSQTPNFWAKGDDPGLIGSLYQYKNFSPTVFNNLDISLILDEKNNEEIPARHSLNTIATLGKSKEGIKYFTAAIIKALYLNGYNAILNQHNDFGAPLEILRKNPFNKSISNYDVLNKESKEGKAFVEIIWESFYKNFQV